MSSLIINALCALTTPIDPKVKLILQKPVPGSNAWPQVVFNDYCYERLGDPGKTEARTRAMAHVFGQAATLLAEKDAEGAFSLRTFYRNAQGADKPRLHISIRPTASASAPTMDVNAALASLTQELADVGFDFSTVPSAISGNTAAYVGFLKAALAKRASQAVQAEVAQASQAVQSGDEAPDI